MDFKECRGQIKAGAAGHIEGIASPYGWPADRGNDVVERGAYRRWLAESGGRVSILLGHKYSDPVGLARLEDRPEGLYLVGSLDMDTDAGRRAFSGAAKGYLSFSIGYDTRTSRKGAGGVRVLTDIELFEVSLVPVPMAPRAVVTLAKENPFNAQFKAIHRGMQKIQQYLDETDRNRAITRTERAIANLGEIVRSLP